MGERRKLEDELIDLQSQLFALANIKDEVWAYHPSNPDFVNPIKLYEELKVSIADVERKVKGVEWRLNSLN